MNIRKGAEEFRTRDSHARQRGGRCMNTKMALGIAALLLGCAVAAVPDSSTRAEAPQPAADRRPSDQLAELETERAVLQTKIQALTDRAGLDLDKRDLSRGIDPPTALFPD